MRIIIDNGFETTRKGNYSRKTALRWSIKVHLSFFQVDIYRKLANSKPAGNGYLLTLIG